MQKSIPDIFDVQVYGDMQPINETLSKARCRIFYKYENRNGGYITDEFAEKLISTVPYAPIKGIFDGEAGDFRDHGWERTEGRIYGVVMADPNFAWEQHEDKDGATRTYACVDVLLFTGLYPQAKLIVGKPQSMELYPPSIKGSWKNMGGPYEYYVYEDASFLGLQVLGDDVEPCFEGASFFSLVSSVNELVEELKKFNLVNKQLEGGKDMDNENSTLGGMNEEDAKEILDKVDKIGEEEKIEDAEEPAEDAEKPAEESEEAEESSEADNDEDDAEADDADAEESEEAGEAEEDSDGSSEEPEAAEGENFELLEQKIAEQDVTIATLSTEKENMANQIQELEAELATLKDFKLQVENLKKTEIIDSYSELLSDEIIETYTAKISEYNNPEELDKDLAYELKKSNASVFSKNKESIPSFVPAGEPEVDGLSKILEKYTKK